ncbi:hypothetical protein OG762_36510 [Streptomyces sp. NBC_01136]|uniref:hypothetical protein n=1 Tax=Streptomyces sp. NBC_01136 TaxID=2903754 RepID=UPI00386DD08F|nr:hypothetical protein OG762_36510 [Streptomyces sp. NBC_01136]
MAVELADYGPKPSIPDAVLQRRAAVRIAEHPHPLDDRLPRLAGQELAMDPVIAAGVLELLDALGLRPKQRRRP